MLEVALGVVISREDMKVVAVNLDISSDCDVSWVMKSLFLSTFLYFLLSKNLPSMIPEFF